jgi:hypothetical protein
MNKKNKEDLRKNLDEAKELLKKAKTDKEKSEAEELVKSAEKELAELEGPEKKPSQAKVKKAEKELEIMNKYGVDALYINSKGAYFTNPNLAELSEKDKSKIKTITRELVESIIK